AAHRPGFVDAFRYHRLPGDYRHNHGRATTTSAMEFVRCTADCRLWIYLRHCLIAAHRGDRLLFDSDFGNDGSDASPDVSGLSDCWLDRAALLRHRAF